MISLQNYKLIIASLLSLATAVTQTYINVPRYRNK